ARKGAVRREGGLGMLRPTRRWVGIRPLALSSFAQSEHRLVMARYLRVLHQGSPRFVELVDGALHLLDGAPWAGGRVLDQTLPISSAPLVPVSPSKIICVAKNYREHAKEMQGEVPEEPLLFFKP